MADSKFPTADADSESKKEAWYRPTRNWRYGRLYLEGEEYNLEGIVPQDDIDAAIEAGHLEAC
jgi:hypothetical protein